MTEYVRGNEMALAFLVAGVHLASIGARGWPWLILAAFLAGTRPVAGGESDDA